MEVRKIVVPLLALGVLVSGTTFCTLTPQTDPSAAATIAAARVTEAAAQATEAAAAQAVARATQMALGLPTDTPPPGPGQLRTPTPATAVAPPPMPSPQTCPIESEPFWHWQVGRVEVADFFFTTSSIGFAVGEPNTLLRTDDGGSSWRVWPIDAPHGLNAIHFSSQEIGWVAGDGGTILRTTDGGLAWQPQPAGTEADLFVIKFLDDETGWAGGSNGTLLRTADGGTSWLAGATGQQISIVDVAFIDAQEGYLVGHSGPMGYVLHTSDGGATWENTDYWDSVPEAIYVAKDQPMWIVGGWTGGKVWRGIGHSSRTIVVENMNPHARFSPHFRDVFFSDTQRGWAVGDDGLAISTRDGGQSWQPMEVHDSAYWKMLRFTSERDAVLAGYSWLDGIQVAHLSDDGMTWSSVPAGGSLTQELDVVDLDFVDPWFGWAVVGGRKADLLITIDGGQSWERHEVLGGGVRQVEFVDRLRGWAIGGGGLVARSDDGGRSWEIQSIPFPEDLQAISFVDRDHGWVVSAKTDPSICPEYHDPFDPEPVALFFTSTGGDEWAGPMCVEVPREMTSSHAPVPPRLHFVDQQTGWIVGEGGLILKTTDGGLNWQPQASGTAVDLTDVYFVDGQTGYVTGEKGVLLETTDGGADWRQQRLGDSTLTGVRFVNRENGWVTSRGVVVLYTSDGGQTWETYALYGNPVTLDAVDEHHVWIGTGGVRAYAPVCLSPPQP
jgi:photosystem II stability/assembly factor-like uncharacterized protein